MVLTNSGGNAYTYGPGTLWGGSSRASRAGMGNYFGIKDKNFCRWWDRLGKKEEPGRPDLQSREEALKEYEDWVNRGRPNSEGHRTEPQPGNQIQANECSAAVKYGLPAAIGGTILVVGGVILYYGWPVLVFL